MANELTGFRKVLVEISVPESVDDSDLLERIQEFAVELVDEFSEDFEEVSLDEIVRNEVSVQSMEEGATYVVTTD